LDGDGATTGAADAKSGDKVKDENNKALNMDLSGIIAALSVSYLF